jgi:C_GCAxxG_C_C family probable redox protein
MGRLREICGAVSGMTMVLSCVFAGDPTDHQKKKELYALIQQAAGDFKAENGSYICRELLGLGAGPSEPTPEARTEAYYKRRPCDEYVAIAARITAEILEKYGKIAK